MSERAIADPSQHGWTEVDGKWMWAGSGSGSGNGSIQDGDTEGQITTWDGTEWTPEGAVVVADGLEVGGPVIAEGGLTQGHRTNSGVFQYEGNLTRIRSYGDVAGSGEFAIEVGGGGGSKTTPALNIGSDGRVDLDNELVVKDKVYLRRQSGDLELPIARYWDGTGKPLAGTDNKGDQLAIGASGGTGLALITKDEKRVEIDDNGNVYITGKLFINGEEVSAGGGGGLWTDNGDGTITANYIAKATNFQTL